MDNIEKKIRELESRVSYNELWIRIFRIVVFGGLGAICGSLIAIVIGICLK